MTTPEQTNSAAVGQSDSNALLERLLDEVQTEWGVGGLDSSTMYGAFAIEVAKRAVLAEREACATWYAKEGWLLDEDDVADAMRKRSNAAAKSPSRSDGRT